MKKLSLNDIRSKFIEFFKSNDHLAEDSYSLIPQSDKSLLLINAGMAPLKNYFMGLEKPPSVRMATCQKCIRTGDIENVGRTSRHATFFEMLGNFSFGDYFKEKSLELGWEFITKELGLSTERLWATVYVDDDEAFEIWEKKIGLPKDRIVRLGKADNFWEIGTGPCGPCSEIYYDRGEKFGCDSKDCKPGCECDRFIEFWNHVFTQYDKDENGNYNLLEKKNIDTGMGLERISCIMQDVDSIFEIDTNKYILERIEKVSQKKYRESEKSDISIRIITDHVKAVTFLVCDGVLPNNEGRGYVLRRLIRRAARHGKLIGIDANFLANLTDSVIDVYKGAYPELVKRSDFIKKVVLLEEERFKATLDSGSGILSGFISELETGGKTVLSGQKIFLLYDTYGFPPDLTLEILEEKGMSMDEDEFNSSLEEQKKVARASRGNKDFRGWEGDPVSELGISEPTRFTGYDDLSADVNILGIIKNGEISSVAMKGDDIIIIPDASPLYAEGGGQVGDKGVITSGSSGLSIQITDTKKNNNGVFMLYGKVKTGVVENGQRVTVSVDRERRLMTCRNHTATHILQKALRNVLGTHVEQSGSYVDSEKLRFDFTHFEHMTKEEIEKTERAVNEQILNPGTLESIVMPIEDAKKLGAMALFGEKYADLVRVVKIGDFSIELCGGTHVERTSDIALFKIVSETGIAAGVRRIEAITGGGILDMLNGYEKKLENIANSIKSGVGELESKANQLYSEYKSVSKQLESIKAKMAEENSKAISSGAVDINGTKLVADIVENAGSDMLKKFGDSIKEGRENIVVVLGTANESKALFLVMADDVAISKGAHSGNIVREIAKIAGGGGGGKPHMAQAGGKNTDMVETAVKSAASILETMIK